jgi:hypothetical protein
MLEDPPRPRFRSLLREKPLVLLLLLIGIYFAKPLFLGQSFYFRDIYLWSLPQRARLVELVKAAGLPLWDPLIHGGQPFLGEPNNAALYPTSVLSFLLPPLTAFNLEVVVHFALCGVAAYLLARVLGLGQSASFISGAVYAFCGFTLSLGNLFNRLLSMPYYPLILLFWHLFLLESKRRWFIAAAICGALTLLAGSPEFSLVFLGVAAVWGLSYPYTEHSPPVHRRLALAVLLVIASAALAAVQLVPALTTVSESQRGRGVGLAAFTSWSLNPRRLPELLIPGFLGRTDTLDPRHFWGTRIEDEGFPFILSISFGVLALGLAAGSFGSRPGQRIFPARVRLFLIAVASLSLAAALGRFFPLLPLVYRLFPFLRAFHAPVKLLGGAILPVALLAGEGAQIRFADNRTGGEPQRRLWPIFGTLAILLTALAALNGASGSVSSTLQRVFFLLPSPDPEIRRQVGFRIATSAGFATIGVLLYAIRRRTPAAWQLPALGAALVIELWLAGRPLNPTAPPELITQTPELARQVSAAIGDGRLFRDANPSTVNLHAPSDEIVWQYRWNLETLNDYTGASFGIPIIFHLDFDGLAPLRIRHLTQVVERLPWERRLPLLSAGAVSLIVTPQQPAEVGLETAWTVPNTSSVRFYVYRNMRAAERIALVNDWAFVRGEREAVTAMISPDFDPRRRVILEATGVPPTPLPCPRAQILRLAAGANFSRFHVLAPCDSYLVFSEVFNRHWVVRVDGRPVDVLHANAAFSAVSLRQGSHQIERRYVPKDLMAGAALSLFAVAVLAFTAFRRRSSRAV